jgi:hypothetical protein
MTSATDVKRRHEAVETVAPPSDDRFGGRA